MLGAYFTSSGADMYIYVYTHTHTHMHAFTHTHTHVHSLVRYLVEHDDNSFMIKSCNLLPTVCRESSYIEPHYTRVLTCAYTTTGK